MQRFLLSAAMVLFLVAGATTTAGGDKGPWQPFLPEDAHGVLARRSAGTIAEATKAQDRTRAEVEEAILAGYVLSVQRKSGELKKEEREKEIAKIKAKMQRKEIFVDMMELYRNKAKGGEGIHADLQYQPKLKNQNGIEALIGALTAKKLSDENLAKVEKELPLLSYRIAVTANLTQYAAPAKNAERWNALADKMRESAVALAESAKEKNADGILKSAEALQNTCTACHREFKGKS